MPSTRLTAAILVALPLCASFAHATDLVPKQLAGGPEEFAAMAAPDPADATIHSKAALVPVEMSIDKSGRRSWQGRLPVQNGRARVLVFGGEHGAWNVELAAPGQSRLKAAGQLARQAAEAEFGVEQDLHAADYYALDGVANGLWTVKLSADGAASNRGFLLIEGDEATELASHQTHKRQRLGERIGFVAQLSAVDAAEQVALGKAAGTISRATLRVTAPDGSVETSTMHDDGQHDDGVAGDGLFGGGFLAKASGQHLAQVMVEGTDRSGQPLLRSAEHVVPIVDAALQLTGARASSRKAAGTRLSIEIPVGADKQGQHYRAFAEVWGRDATGAPRPVAWVGGMVTPAAGKVALGFDQRWVQRAGAQAPFELRNLRLEDPDHFITLADAPRLPLTLPADIGKAAAGKIAIDDTMRMGPRPAVAKGVGTRLLLVHGYCSGGVWPTANFTNASTFLDANQNRSHDQFARLIKTFGSTWNSFGVVAHSQGGAAALHLYNYYWSGLDYATGNRLIQSVGTPYKGTNLAGILAALGSWFGVGCGTNDNLSYSGASAWLAGIPSSSRAKVNYYTTAFRTTNWYTNDYCNFATDLVLSDPEDGTTEQVNGQLPYAINRGHTAGQCHTSGMRDPAQTKDATRNATMNANAAR
jgi:hypothetical protein